MSPAEVILWQHLLAGPEGLKFRRQHPVGRFVADFYCPSGKLVVEVDGDAHDFERRGEFDEQRDAVLRELGLRTLRIPAGEIYRDLSAVLIAIIEAADLDEPLHPSLRERSPSP